MASIGGSAPTAPNHLSRRHEPASRDVGLLVARSRRRSGSRLLRTRFSGFARPETARSRGRVLRMAGSPSGAALHGFPARFFGRRVDSLSWLSARCIWSLAAITDCHRSSPVLTPSFVRPCQPVTCVVAQYAFATSVNPRLSDRPIRIGSLGRRHVPPGRSARGHISRQRAISDARHAGRRRSRHPQCRSGRPEPWLHQRSTPCHGLDAPGR